MKKVKIIDNEVVITDERGSYILDKKEYIMSHIEAVEKLGDKIPLISQQLFLKNNLKEINKALLKVGGEIISDNGVYWCREQYSALSAWRVYMRNSSINSYTRSGTYAVRAVSAFKSTDEVGDVYGVID
jgi:hypothetical protein